MDFSFIYLFLFLGFIYSLWALPERQRVHYPAAAGATELPQPAGLLPGTPVQHPRRGTP